MKVLQIAARMKSLANFALPLMERLRGEGHEVEALGGYDGFEERLTEAGFPAHAWSADHRLDPLMVWEARRELATLLDQAQYDIVHTHCSFGGIIANPVAHPRTRCLVYTQHGFYVHQGLSHLRRRLWLAIEKVGLRSAHHVICISQAERSLALTLGVGPPDKFHHVPGAGVRTEQFHLSDEARGQKRAEVRAELGIGPDETVILTVSRLTWDKGYSEMAVAVRQLRDDGFRLRLLAAGSGKDEKGIRRAIHDADIEDEFVLLGWRDDVPSLYCAADIFVFASHREGLPISPIEAMASGLPVVASDIPGCCEEIEHEEDGLLFAVGEGQALTDALRRLLEDAALARRMGDAAIQAAERFALGQVLDAQAKLYAELAGQQ